MILAIAIGAPAGYALSRFDFAGKELFRIMILLTRISAAASGLASGGIFHSHRA